MSLPLLHGVANIIKAVFIAKGWGADPDVKPLGTWPVNADKEAGQPDNVLTVYATLGSDDGRSMIDGEKLRHPGLQVRVRSLVPKDGKAKAEYLRWALNEDAYNVTVALDSATYVLHCFARVGDVLSIGTEDAVSKRNLFTLNALASLRRAI